VIVGGGFAGAATGWWLIQRGLREVVVVERETRLGVHASGRSAAMGRQVLDHDDDTALAVRGAAWLRRQAMVQPPGFWDETGSVVTFDDDDEGLVRLRQYADRAERFAVPCHLVDRAAMATRAPWDGGGRAWGLEFPGDGVIDLHGLLAWLAAEIRAGGGQVVLGAEVVGASADADGVALATSRGMIQTDLVVDAAGAWAGTLARRLGGRDPGIAAFKRHVFVVGAQAARPGYTWHLGRAEGYLRPASDGIMTSYCDALPAFPGDPAVDDDASDQLRQWLAASAPALADQAIVRSWACLRTFLPGDRPLMEMDPHHHWLFWVAGLGGFGATAAMAIGELAAERICAHLG
jgi:D-arginine dehydrogenase